MQCTSLPLVEYPLYRQGTKLYGPQHKIHSACVLCTRISKPNCSSCMSSCSMRRVFAGHSATSGSRSKTRRFMQIQSASDVLTDELKCPQLTIFEIHRLVLLISEHSTQEVSTTHDVIGCSQLHKLLVLPRGLSFDVYILREFALKAVSHVRT